MQSSPEPGRGAVLLDANVLSRLAHIRRSDILDRAGVKCLHFHTLVEALEQRGLLTSEQARQALEQASSFALPARHPHHLPGEPPPRPHPPGRGRRQIFTNFAA